MALLKSPVIIKAASGCVVSRSLIFLYNSLSAWSVLAWGGDINSRDYDGCKFPRSPEWSRQKRMKFQIRGAEGFNRVYVPFITPQVVNIETDTSASAFPCELLCSIRAVHGEARELDG